MKLLPILALFFAMSCSTPTKTAGTSTSTAPATPPTEVAAASYAGDWNVEVKGTPAGDVTGTLTLVEGADGMTGSFMAGDETTDLRSVKKTDDGLTINFYSQEYQTDVDIKLTGAPTDNELSGSTMGSFATVATRKM